MEILQGISLKDYNTFGVNVKAEYFCVARNVEQLESLIESKLSSDNSYLVLGGGSNVLFTEDYSGVIVIPKLKGIKISESTDDYVVLTVGAGEKWANFVEICLKNKWYGLENLACIPGRVGAAPIQNIGAYGAEQSDFFHSLTGYDTRKKEFVTMSKEDCHFSYRDSVFKNELLDKFIVTEVRYKLSKKQILNTSYKDIKREIEKFVVKNPDSQYIYDTVARLRKRKLPDPAILGNAGSFFKNPIIENDKYNNIKHLIEDVPVFRIDNNKIKLSAAWLIEKLGWKGKRRGDAGVYENHSLILVNYGKAKGEEILSLAKDIERSVLDSYDIALEREVRVI